MKMPTEKSYTESEVVEFCRLYADAEGISNSLKKTGVDGLSENNKLQSAIFLEKYLEKVPESLRKRLDINEKSLLEELCKK